MSRVRRVARAAAFRAMVRELLALLGPALTWAFVAAGLLVVADRLLSLELSMLALVAAPVVAGVGASAAMALSRRPSEAGAAAEVDRALGLRDRLSSAIEFEGDASRRDDAFVRWATEDAEARAAGASAAKAYPLKIGGWWAVWPALGAVVVAAAALAPSVDLLGKRAEREVRLRAAAERAAAAEEIASAREEVREALERAADTANAATPEALRAIEELEEELTGGRVGADEARSRAAAALEQAAQGADQEAARMERELEALSEKFGQIRPDEQSTPLSEELAEALRNSDFERAAELLDELARADGGAPMDPMEREALARDLERLAQQLESAGEGTPLEQERSAPGQEESLEDLMNQGLSEEDARRLSAMSDEEQLRQELKDQGVAPEVADRLAERIAQENQQREAREQAEREAKELSNALKDAAEDVRQPPAAPEPPNEGPQSGELGEQKPGETGAQEKQSEQGQEREGAGQEPAPTPAPTPEQQQSGERQPGEQSQEQQGGEEQREGSGERPNTPEGLKSGQQREEQGQEPSSASEERRGERGPSDEAPGSEGQDESTRPESSEGEGTEQGQAQKEDASGAERARRALEEMERRKDGAAEQREGAEAMRERARRMMEQSSPEQRQEAERWARQAEREEGEGDPGAGAMSGGEGVREGVASGERGFETENVDARRGSSEDGRVAAEWVDPNAPAARGSASSRSVDEVREAARSAERAVEEQNVSSRYSRVVREFFRRRVEAAERRAEEPAPTPASDVE